MGTANKSGYVVLPANLGFLNMNFNPADLDNLLAWYRAQDGTPYVPATNVNWKQPDHTGNAANTLFGYGAIEDPVILPAGIGGRPCWVKQNASGQNYPPRTATAAVTPAFQFGLADTFAVSCIFELGVDGSQSAVPSGGLFSCESDYKGWWVEIKNGVLQFTTSASANQYARVVKGSTPLRLATPYQVEVVHLGNTAGAANAMAIYLNGVAETLTGVVDNIPAGTDFVQPSASLAVADPSGAAGTGFAEMIVRKAAFTAADLSGLRSYYKNQYGF